VKDRAHDFSTFCPLFTFSKHDSISKNSDPVFNEEPFLDIIFLTQIKFSQQLWIDQDNKDSIKSISYQSSHAGIGFIGYFGEIILISFLLKRFLCQIESTNQGDKRQNVNFFVIFKTANPHVGFVDVLEDQIDEIDAYCQQYHSPKHSANLYIFIKKVYSG